MFSSKLHAINYLNYFLSLFMISFNLFIIIFKKLMFVLKNKRQVDQAIQKNLMFVLKN